jgi:hypothetical protein
VRAFVVNLLSHTKESAVLDGAMTSFHVEKRRVDSKPNGSQGDHGACTVHHAFGRHLASLWRLICIIGAFHVLKSASHEMDEKVFVR